MFNMLYLSTMSIKISLQFLLVFWNQGAELMSKYGVNVPKGAAVSSVEEVRKVIQDVFPKENEVILPAVLQI